MSGRISARATVVAAAATRRLALATLATLVTLATFAAPIAPVATAGVLRAQQARPDLPVQPHLPLDWRVRMADGTDVRLDAFRGRPIFLNLWATWCAPCVAELASIAALRDSLAARGADDVVFLLVAPETRARVDRFRRRHPWDLPYAVELDRLPPVLGLKAVPSTWLIDRHGRIAYTHRGAAKWDAPDVVDFVIRTLP